MPIIQSAKKSIRQDKKKRVKNIREKRALKSLLKKAQVFIEQNKKEELKKILPDIYKKLDKATKHNILKKNTSSRTKSRLAKKTN